MQMEEKTYTQKEVDDIVNNTRIEERYIANQVMGDLGIPANQRLGPGGKLIYTQAADIVMSMMLKPAPEPETPKT